MLTQLQKQGVFQLHEFEKVIDSIRDCVAEVGVAILPSINILPSIILIMYL